MRIGPYQTSNSVFVAPMAGVTDRPFRSLCKQLGAGYAVSEMVTSRPDLWGSLKTSRRANHDGESGPIAVQLAGTEPQMMAQAARYNLERGAQIIDINMGCPAKKVCNKWAGSALMQDEALAIAIVQAVVDAALPFGAPVTLKMRTGWRADHRNALSLARQAESAGVQMITVHGRTREQGYSGQAEYDSIAQVKAAVSIPVVANGDIDSPRKALEVLQVTGADAVMVGRAALGRPWIFREIDHFLKHGTLLAPPLVAEVKRLMLQHLQAHHSLYGRFTGVRSARKHIVWYTHGLANATDFKQAMNRIEDCETQLRVVADYFDRLAQLGDRLVPAETATALETSE
ncbi:MAG: tRNA dihydrouridine synthase DusB [Betaproteobacteria bacterium]|nr:tRNA dihydrouridine synthase DusB [Betaproteobacteria bacterium]